jgi:hypothetical protein
MIEREPRQLADCCCYSITATLYIGAGAGGQAGGDWHVCTVHAWLPNGAHNGALGC